MSISYNLGIPAAGNNPSQDQPNMQTNNDNIGTYVAVDHIGFISSGDTGVSGHHKQVTFDNNYVPSVPTTPPVLFTNIQDGAGNNLPGALAQLFYYTGVAASAKNNYVSKANGSVLVFGGIILKWGIGSLDDNPTVFPVPFPNACFVAFAVSDKATYLGSFITKAVDPTFATFQRTSGSGDTEFYYFAIGN